MAPPATVTVYRHGLSAGVSGAGGGLRREVQGWSVKSSRANTRFLYAVREDELTGYGLSLSLTVHQCPPSHEKWAGLRRAFIKRLERLGLVRGHWLTEWQRRGVPHMHAAVWFPEGLGQREESRLAALVLADWLSLSAPYDSSQRAQSVQPIYGVMGWLQYLSKHGARGAAHYQRARSGIPEGWQRTGRMWGHVGPWPLQEPLRLHVDRQGWFYLRRAARGFLVAQARAKGRWRAVASARRMLQASERPLAELRGVGGWIPDRVGLGLVGYVAGRGCEVVNADEVD